MSRRIFIVQYGGDYREAYHRLASGGAETYRGQRYTVDTVTELTRFGEVATMTLATPEAYEELLVSGVKVIGLGLKSYPEDWTPIVDRIAAWVPTHLVVRMLSAEVLDWASNRDLRTLAMLAETHANRGGLIGLLQTWRNSKLAEILNRPRIEWVANHHYSATRWLEEIGVRRDKLIAYDYEYPISPEQFPPKSLRETGPWVVAYAGMLIDGKGVRDLLDAASILHQSGMNIEVRLVGQGAKEPFRRHAEKLGIAEQTKFLGSIANDDVVRLMRDADLVVVPSRKDYSESFGFVVQEAFLSRTPLITSDHRAFAGRVVHEKTGLVFRAGESKDLAEKAKRLLGDAKLYRKLSEASAAAWQGMQIPAKWADVLKRWIADMPQDVQWLRDRTLPKV